MDNVKGTEDKSRLVVCSVGLLPLIVLILYTLNAWIKLLNTDCLAKLSILCQKKGVQQRTLLRMTYHDFESHEFELTTISAYGTFFSFYFMGLTQILLWWYC